MIILLVLFSTVDLAFSQELNEELALQKCQMIRQKIIEGADFGEMARRFSEDPGTASRGGEVGYMMPGSLVEEYWNAAYDLEKGQLSEPVRSKFGFHLIEVLGKKGGAINTRHILIIPK